MEDLMNNALVGTIAAMLADNLRKNEQRTREKVDALKAGLKDLEVCKKSDS